MHPSSGRNAAAVAAPPPPFTWSALAAAPQSPFTAAPAQPTVAAAAAAVCQHTLVYGVTPGHPAYARGWSCNGCPARGDDAARTRRWVCAVCVYDLCDACGARCSGCGASFGAAAYYGCSACATVNFCGACERNGACEAHAPSPGTANSRDGRSHVFVRTRLGINATLQGLRAAHCS